MWKINFPWWKPFLAGFPWIQATWDSKTNGSAFFSRKILREKTGKGSNDACTLEAKAFLLVTETRYQFEGDRSPGYGLSNARTLAYPGPLRLCLSFCKVLFWWSMEWRSGLSRLYS